MAGEDANKDTVAAVEEATVLCTEVDDMLDSLTRNPDAYFKSQQRGEKELSDDEKREIAFAILSQSKATFLSRFGKCLREQDLAYFERFTSDEAEGYDIGFYANDLRRYFAKRDREVKNRRYDAMKRMIENDDSYFSESEMMKRNPLLYDQLVGRFLSDEEKKKRDVRDSKELSFVNILLESIDREDAKKKQKLQQDDEDCAMEEDEDEADDGNDAIIDEEPTERGNIMTDERFDKEARSTARWGEFKDGAETETTQKSAPPRNEIVMITATERCLLREEFASIMYRSFLDGNDADFDYSQVDNNEDYDNLDIKNNDAEEKYFDSESPEDLLPGTEMEQGDEAEDELDVYMHRLNQNFAIQELSRNMDRL